VQLLVLVESWGELRDSAAAERLIAPLLAVSREQGRDPIRGRVSAIGGTVAGEFRELCGVSYRSAHVDSTLARGCWLRRLREQGVHTVGMHAYDGLLYLRSTWYPAIGFSEWHFAPELEAPGHAPCGVTLRGACDWDVAPVVSARLATARRRGERTLVYWLTLSGHVPVRVPEEQQRECDADPLLASEPLVCGWYLVTRRTLRAVAELAREHPDVEILLVGDHQPPFGRASSRAAFVEGAVPFLRLSASR
jgi:phosphoglycerol transferase MdoB-like AlkP superfamily enzyme